MAVCTTGAEWASESAFGPEPLLQIVPAILRAVRDSHKRRPLLRAKQKEQQRAEPHGTPCFKGVCRTPLKIKTGLVVSRPLRRRLRRWWCRCLFPLCHSKSLNGRSGMSRDNLYKIERIIAQESPYRRFRSHQSGQRGNRSKPILGVAFSLTILRKSWCG